VSGSDLQALPGPAGLVMLAAGGMLVLVGLAAVVPAALRVRRRVAALRATVAAGQLDVERALALLAAERAETEALVAPWRRLVRLARHPLVAASVQWYLRRRRRARS
jgi:hypothetical protein